MHCWRSGVEVGNVAWGGQQGFGEEKVTLERGLGHLQREPSRILSDVGKLPWLKQQAEKVCCEHST